MPCLDLVGLLLNFIGTIFLSISVLMDKKTADELSATKYGKNEKLRKLFLKQSRLAKIGLLFFFLGFISQVAYNCC
jgi:hypothetical protein